MSAEWRLSIAFSFNIDFRRAATMAASRAAAVEIVLRPSTAQSVSKDRINVEAAARMIYAAVPPRVRNGMSAWQR